MPQTEAGLAMQRTTPLLAFVIWAAGLAWAQPVQNPVVEHFRAYQAALSANDLPRAEIEAESALSSSESRDGDGGRTAVLALNLAAVRLMMRNALDALDPAEKALRLAQAGAHGVDPRLAGLLLGRIELAASGRQGADRLNALLGSPLDGVAAPDIYAAASELGAWSLNSRDFNTARTAWRVAALHADGGPYGREHGFAAARIGEGAAIVFAAMGDNGRARMPREAAIEADGLFREARETIAGALVGSEVHEQPTVAERLYGEALAWRAIVRAKVTSDGQRSLPDDETDDSVNLEQSMTPPALGTRCAVRTSRSPIEYPPGAADRSQIGVVVVRMRFDGDRVLGHTILASLGDAGFAQWIDREAATWRVVRRPDAAPHCTMSGFTLVIVSFQM